MRWICNHNTVPYALLHCVKSHAEICVFVWFWWWQGELVCIKMHIAKMQRCILHKAISIAAHNQNSFLCAANFKNLLPSHLAPEYMDTHLQVNSLVNYSLVPSKFVISSSLWKIIALFLPTQLQVLHKQQFIIKLVLSLYFVECIIRLRAVKKNFGTAH